MTAWFLNIGENGKAVRESDGPQIHDIINEASEEMRVRTIMHGKKK
ncbi:MAG: hypothetical protein ACLUOI_02545 [Eisenbergiella sp.]